RDPRVDGAAAGGDDRRAARGRGPREPDVRRDGRGAVEEAEGLVLTLGPRRRGVEVVDEAAGTCDDLRGGAVVTTREEGRGAGGQGRSARAGRRHRDLRGSAALGRSLRGELRGGG